jgi:UDP-N-acetylglucosamine 2-epimerase (non-hydrolysing)
MKRFRVGVIIGTRPEAIKLAPVIQALNASPRFSVVTILTSQHRDMVRPILRSFKIQCDVDLKVMKHRQTLSELSSRLCSALGNLFSRSHFDAVLVQGDTSTAFFGGLCAFYHKIPVGHVEAGLRSHNNYSPFPEEVNRSLLGRIATWHFAPTKLSASNLRSENIHPKKIYQVGNTIVDALKWMAPRIRVKPVVRLKKGEKLILITCHRRENFGKPMEQIADAIRMLAVKNPQMRFVLPVHPNPHVVSVVVPRFSKVPNICLTKPLDYDQFLDLLRKAYLVLSDSGGVQEESTALGKPVLVLRTETERPEGIQAGALKLVGVKYDVILKEAQRVLRDAQVYKRMTRASNVFGDGRSAGRIRDILCKSLMSRESR